MEANESPETFYTWLHSVTTRGFCIRMVRRCSKYTRILTHINKEINHILCVETCVCTKRLQHTQLYIEMGNKWDPWCFRTSDGKGFWTLTAVCEIPFIYCSIKTITGLITGLFCSLKTHSMSPWFNKDSAEVSENQGPWWALITDSKPASEVDYYPLSFQESTKQIDLPEKKIKVT